MRKFPYVKQNFGGLFERPITVDEFVRMSAEYLPTLIEAQASAKPSETLLSLLESDPGTETLRQAYCTNPGLTQLFEFGAKVGLSKLQRVESA